jgi:hypothetical protein
VESIKQADSIFKDRIAPALEKSKGVHSTGDIFSTLEKKIAQEPALLRRKELMDGYNALKEEYGGLGRDKWTTKDLQNEKSSLDQFTPTKIFK